jgi:hypothetical protein
MLVIPSKITFRKMSCQIIQDMVKIAKTLERKLKDDEHMEKFKPSFILVGSVPEKTRLALGNELDITIEFEALKECPFVINKEDSFHLTIAEHAPKWLKKTYLTSDRKFDIVKFMSHLFQAVHSSINIVFEGNKEPARLMRKTSNDAFSRKKFNCPDCTLLNEERRDSLFKQCKNCVVTVSQSKIGICLQFLWKPDDGGKDVVYCSIDLVPTFPIEDFPPLELAKMVNEAMLNEQPGTGFTNISTIFLSFFYLFSIFFLNCF